MSDNKETEIHRVKFIDVNMSRFDVGITLYDHPNCVVYSKHFYIYQGGAETFETILEKVVAIASKYGVSEIWINEDGLGAATADHLIKRHTRDGFALYKYKDKRLEL